MLLPQDFAVLNLSRLELRLQAQEDVSLPPYLGSTLRGAFGHALKQVVCIMPHRQCERCMVADRCLYPYLFETPAPPDLPQLRGQAQAPHPFILSPPDPAPGRLQLRAGNTLLFKLALMGRAIEYLPYVIYAVQEMGRRGLGVTRAGFDLIEARMVYTDGTGETVYNGESQRITATPKAAAGLDVLIQKRLVEQAAAERVRLRFLTPTRIRVDGDLQSELSFALLARNLFRRVSMLAAVHGCQPLQLDFRGLLDRAATVRTRQAALGWSDWERYSNRQQTRMRMGGFIGEVEYEGAALAGFLPLLAAGEILHVGTGTSFGLGRFEIAM